MFYYGAMGFKENLKSELQYNGMLVKELAYKTGIKKQTIDNYLNSHNVMPSAEAAVKIAKALNTTVEFLLTGDPDQRHLVIQSKECSNLIMKYEKLSKEKKEVLNKLIDLL